MMFTISKRFSQHAYKALLFCASFVFLAAIFLPAASYAQGADAFGVQAINDTVSLSSTDFRVIIGRVIQVALGLLGVIALGLIIYAGFTIMTAGGSEDRVADGKKILVNATVGLVIILSAMGITQFVLNALSNATGSGLGGQVSGDGSDGTGGPKKFFSGSGSLGKIIKDHYPARDQKDVPRNTKIVVTFAESIDPASVMENTNNTCWGADGKPTVCADGLVPYYGDCTFEKPNFSWEKDCDQVKTDSVRIYRKDDSDKKAVSAAVLAVYTAEKTIDTFTFRPIASLGDSKQPTWYIVDLTSKIMKQGKNTSAFVSELAGHYAWEFETNVNEDFSAPKVLGVYPGKSSTVDRNNIVQIEFSEPVDPTAVQGAAGPTTPYKNIIFKDKNIAGEWRLSNGYKTAEFVSNQSCGENSCGDIMYCLPVATCAANDTSCTQNYEILIRTAQLLAAGQTTFESKSGTGIMDMAGNSLDGNNNNKPEGRPDYADIKVMTAEEVKSDYDNYLWQFGVKNSIDLSAPYIEQVSPGLDKEGVNGVEPVTIQFSKPMMVGSFYNSIQIVEHEPAKNPDGNLADWWTVPTGQTVNGKTKATVTHREFGPNGQDLFYFVSVSSSVQSVTQNCLYPGIGPTAAESGASPLCMGGNATLQNCVPVQKQANVDTGCSVTDGSISLADIDITSCITKLKALVKPKPKTP